HPRPSRRPAHPGDRRRPRRLPPGDHGRDAPDPPDLPVGHRPAQQQPAPPGGRPGRRRSLGRRPRPERLRPGYPPAPHHPIAEATPPLLPGKPSPAVPQDRGGHQPSRRDAEPQGPAPLRSKVTPGEPPKAGHPLPDTSDAATEHGKEHPRPDRRPNPKELAQAPTPT